MDTSQIGELMCTTQFKISVTRASLREIINNSVVETLSRETCCYCWEESSLYLGAWSSMGERCTRLYLLLRLQWFVRAAMTHGIRCPLETQLHGHGVQGGGGENTAKSCTPRGGFDKVALTSIQLFYRRFCKIQKWGFGVLRGTSEWGTFGGFWKHVFLGNLKDEIKGLLIISCKTSHSEVICEILQFFSTWVIDVFHKIKKLGDVVLEILLEWSVLGGFIKTRFFGNLKDEVKGFLINSEKSSHSEVICEIIQFFITWVIDVFAKIKKLVVVVLEIFLELTYLGGFIKTSFLEKSWNTLTPKLLQIWELRFFWCVDLYYFSISSITLKLFINRILWKKHIF